MRDRCSTRQARQPAMLLAVSLLGACAAPAPRPAPAPPAVAPAAELRVEPLAEVLAPAPPARDPVTGLPLGWYVPTPPPAEEPPPPLPGTAAAPEPAPPPDPARRTRFLLRENPWIAGFWAELAPAERARAERAFARRGEHDDLPAAWDRLGLAERVLLLFGPGRAPAAGQARGGAG